METVINDGTVSLLFFQQIPLAGPAANLDCNSCRGTFSLCRWFCWRVCHTCFSVAELLNSNLYLLAEFLLQLLWYLLDYMAVGSRRSCHFHLAIPQSPWQDLLFAVLIVLLPAGLKLRKAGAGRAAGIFLSIPASGLATG